MGNSHPTLTLEYKSSLAPLQVIQQVGSIVRKNRDYTVLGRSSGSDKAADIELIYSTPGCGWLDKISIKATRGEEEFTRIIVSAKHQEHKGLTTTGDFFMHECLLWLVRSRPIIMQLLSRLFRQRTKCQTYPSTHPPTHQSTSPIPLPNLSFRN